MRLCQGSLSPTFEFEMLYLGERDGTFVTTMCAGRSRVHSLCEADSCDRSKHLEQEREEACGSQRTGLQVHEAMLCFVAFPTPRFPGSRPGGCFVALHGLPRRAARPVEGPISGT